MKQVKKRFWSAVSAYPDILAEEPALAAHARIIEKYPYFVVPYVLKAFAYHISDELGRWDALADAALRVPDRRIFRRLLIALVQRKNLENSGPPPEETLEDLLKQLGVEDDDNSSTADIASPAPEAPMVTETMARLLEMQGAYDEAVQCYRILIEKNPEKSDYFADRIKAIQQKKYPS